MGGGRTGEDEGDEGAPVASVVVVWTATISGDEGRVGQGRDGRYRSWGSYMAGTSILPLLTMK